MKISHGPNILFALALSSISAMASAANIIGDVMFAGGMPTPNGPVSGGTALYDNGDVVFYRNYMDASRNVAVVVAHVSSVQVQQLLTASANLTDETLVRDAGPSCTDAPYQSITIRNQAGQMVLISDKMACRDGHRADRLGTHEASFLHGLNIVASYGQH